MPLTIPGKLKVQETDNVFGGDGAGVSLTIGADNVFLGDDSGALITVGSFNTILGSHSGADNFNITSAQNVAIGANAGGGNDGVVTNIGSVFIGYNAGVSAAGKTNKLYIANSNTATPLIYGEFDTPKVIINGALETTGTYSPTKILLPQVNEPATPTLAFSDGDTGFYEISDDVIGISIGGGVDFHIVANTLRGALGDAGAILNETATNLNPTLIPARNDVDTGIGWPAADSLSAIGGGVEIARFETQATLIAGETTLWLYDKDNGALEQVTVGAADSGGAGFKLLRIAN